eukprot:g6127.t1
MPRAILFGDLKLAGRTFYHCHRVDTTTCNLVSCCFPCFTSKKQRSSNSKKSPTGKLANEGSSATTSTTITTRVRGIPPPTPLTPPQPNTSNQGVRLENGPQEQVLSNAMNNFWKPEQPTVMSESSAIPLSLVVSDAVKRWFDDTYRDAQRGDVKQQALLGQMLMEGYGCVKDPVAGAEWTERAKRRGYKMDGVYCKL